MARATYRQCKFCGAFHNLAEWPDNHRDAPPERSSLPAPMLALDTMDALWHPHTGQMMDSKSAFRSVTKAAGGEEVGNEVQRDNRRADQVTKDEVAQAVSMVKQGYKPSAAETASEGWS